MDCTRCYSEPMLNTRSDHETEQFEDDPLEYIRVDLSIPSASTGGSSEGTTRRHAAADVLRALVGAGSEAEATEYVSMWVSEDLQAFKTDPGANWKRKDRAIYLLTAIAARGSTSHVRLSAFFITFRYSHRLNVWLHIRM
jgi:exportin-2 (importin alpha re-exporter)